NRGDGGKSGGSRRGREPAFLLMITHSRFDGQANLCVADNGDTGAGIAKPQAAAHEVRRLRLCDHRFRSIGPVRWQLVMPPLRAIVSTAPTLPVSDCRRTL